MFTPARIDEEYGLRVLIHWLGTTFFSGLMNAVAFVGLGMFATHVTGFATLLGVHLASGRWIEALTAIAVPLFFLAGSIISGLLIDARLKNSKYPHYDWVMYLCVTLLLLAVYFSELRAIPVDFVHFELKNNLIPLSAISMASGLMNAALSHASHSTMRIAHLTGITTDLGRGIAELISFRFQKFPERERVLKTSRLRALTVAFFILGSLLGALLFQRMGFFALLFPATYFLYAGILARITRERSRA